MTPDFRNNTKTVETLSDLCDLKSFPKRSRFVLFLAYSPFGFFFFILRIIFILAVITGTKLGVLRPSPALCRFSLRIIGLRIARNGSVPDLAAYADGCVVPSNHVSLLDIFMIIDMPYATILVGHPLKETNIITRIMFAFITCISSTKFWYVTDRRNFVRHLAEWRKNPAGTTLYTTPEMTISNSRGLFCFNSAFVCMGRPIVPSSIQLAIPFSMAAHPLHSNGAAIFLRLLMMPWVRCTLTYLARIEGTSGSKTAIATQVQTAIASSLGITPTEYTAADKYAFRKNTR